MLVIGSSDTAGTSLPDPSVARELGEAIGEAVEVIDLPVFHQGPKAVPRVTGALDRHQPDLVVFAFGAYAFGALRRLILDIQGPEQLLGLRNPFFYNPYWGFFLQMLPYAFTIAILVLGSREAVRNRLGAPAALGLPYVRGERGR
jgi:hypothetical protein